MSLWKTCARVAFVMVLASGFAADVMFILQAIGLL